MASVDISHIDLESSGGHRRRSSAVNDGDNENSDFESVCFSDADEGSCFYSTADGSYDDYSIACGSDHEIGVSESRRLSSASESDCSVDIETGIRKVKVHLRRVERDCRICHLSLVSTAQPESGIAIQLGCSCKGDLAAAHKNCAETWFKIKGNKTCEICNTVARNILSANEVVESTQQTNEADATATNTASASVPPTAETRSCLNGHRCVNCLLACMVFAFVISWLFHFNIPS